MLVASCEEIFIREKEIQEYVLKFRLRFFSYYNLTVYETVFSGKVLPTFKRKIILLLPYSTLKVIITCFSTCWYPQTELPGVITHMATLFIHITVVSPNLRQNTDVNK